MESGDVLRASFFTEQQEAFSYRSSLLAGVVKTELLSRASAYAPGDKLALRADTSLAYYVCIKDLEAGSFVNGLNAPENYPDNFLKAESTDGFDSVTPVSGLAERHYSRNEKIVLQSGYWEYYTCIRAFSGTADYVEGTVSPADYPGHFVRGLPIGDALPCKGNWEFYCSGGWYGSYEVRRSYDGPGLDREWETRGSSFSRLGASSNTLITGTESGEECHVRLFLTRSKYVDDSLENGFPDDTCSNKLVVSSYKHDMLLKYTETMDEDTDVPVASGWQYVSPIKHGFTGRREVIDWSWCAFRPAYGYPILAEIFGQRLVFASTAAQPPAPGEEQAPPNPDNPGEAAPESGEVDFSLDAPPPDGKEQPGDETEPGDPEDSKEPEKPYELELPDDLDVTDDFKATLKEHAKASGLEGKAAGKFVSGVIKSMQEAEQANIAATTKELREDWGKNFNANMKSVKEFAGKLKQKSGLTTEDLAPLQSPRGYRLLYALMKSVGEDAFVSGKEAQPEDPQKEAQRMLTDPSHRYFRAIQDPTDPLFKEANQEYNRLVGFSQ